MKKLFIFSIATLFAISGWAAKPKTLKLNLQQGQKFTHEVNVNAKFEIKVSGVNVKFDFPMFLTLNYEVMSEDLADTVVLKTELNAFKVEFDIFNKKFNFDSENITNSDDKYSGMLKDMLHKPFEIHYDKYRNITNIIGLDDVLKKNISVKKDSISFENEKKLANFGDIGSIYDKDVEDQEDDIIDDVIEDDNDTFLSIANDIISNLYDALNLVVFPKNSAKKDLQWTQNVLFEEEEGKIDVEKLFKIKKITNNDTEISRMAEYSIDLKNNKISNKVEVKNCTTNGIIILDNNSCWINSANNTFKLSLEGNDKEMGKMLITITVNTIITSK